MSPLHPIEHFSVTQKITMMVNRYEVREVDANGKPGALMALAQQKRAACGTGMT